MLETTITHRPDPSGFSVDLFTDVLRDGARKLIEQAIHAELATLVERHAKLTPIWSAPLGLDTIMRLF